MFAFELGFKSSQGLNYLLKRKKKKELRKKKKRGLGLRLHWAETCPPSPSQGLSVLDSSQPWPEPLAGGACLSATQPKKGTCIKLSFSGLGRDLKFRCK